MLSKVFLTVLDMSITAGWVILFVMLIRLLLGKCPKAFSYVLWAVVLVRLVCPFSFESAVSLVPPIDLSAGGTAGTGITGVMAQGPDAALQGMDPVSPAFPEAVGAVTDKMGLILSIAAALWIVGMAFMIGRNLIGLVKLNHRLQTAKQAGENIYYSDQIETAFVMGAFKPRIYLPEGLSPKEIDCILLHEQTHIKRFDHIIKIIAFAVLCLHWFNPLVWLAFFASTKDMEMSCDESVIKTLGSSYKKDYSASLLSLASGRCTARGVPLAFSEGDTKSRVKNILNYKKTAFWLAILLVAAVVTASVALVTDRKEKDDILSDNNQKEISEEDQRIAEAEEELRIQNEAFQEAYEKLIGEEKAILEDKLTRIITSHKNGTFESMENHHEPWPEDFPRPSVLPEKITDENYKVYYSPGKMANDPPYLSPYLKVWLNISDDYYYVFDPAWFSDQEGNETLGFGNSGFYKGAPPDLKAWYNISDDSLIRP